MSHFTTVETRIFDIQALEEALKDLKFTVTHNALVHGWAGNRLKADLVASTYDSKYDIGFLRNPETNNYGAVADWWGVKTSTGIDERTFIQKLTQRYAYRKVLKEVQKQGFVVAEDTVESDQSIRLLVRKW